MSNATNSTGGPTDAEFDLWYVGVLMQCLSSFFGALGNLFIKQSFTVKEAADGDAALDPAGRRRAKLISWAYWLLGAPIFTIVLGSLINMAAFAFAAQSLLSPFAATTIVWNALLAPCYLKEQLTRRDIVGTAVVISGCVCAGVFAPHSTATYTLDELLQLYAKPPFVAYGSMIAALLLGAFFGGRARYVPLRRLCSSALPGMIVGNTNVLAKSFSELMAQAFSHHDFSAYLRLPSWLISAGAIFLPLTNLYFLGRALAQFPAGKVVPVYFSTIVLTSTLSGGIYFQELGGLPTAAAVGLALGALLVMLGVYFISSGGEKAEDDAYKGFDDLDSRRRSSSIQIVHSPTTGACRLSHGRLSEHLVDRLVTGEQLAGSPDAPSASGGAASPSSALPGSASAGELAASALPPSVAGDADARGGGSSLLHGAAGGVGASPPRPGLLVEEEAASSPSRDGERRWSGERRLSGEKNQGEINALIPDVDD